MSSHSTVVRGESSPAKQSTNVPVPPRGGSSTERYEHLRILYITVGGRRQEVYSVAPGPKDLRDITFEVETKDRLHVLENDDFFRSLDSPDHTILAIMTHVNYTRTRLRDGTMNRWGFSSASRKDKLDPIDCDIKRIVLADGKDNMFPHIGYYASRRSTAGVDTFFEFDFFTLDVHGLP